MFKTAIILAALTLFANLGAVSQSLVNVSSGAQIHIRSGARIDINGSITLSSTSILNITDTATVSITGNWLNSGSTFTPGNSTFIFDGSVQQLITKTIDANETFNSVILNNAAGVSAENIGSSSAYGITMNGSLIFNSGILSCRSRYAKVAIAVTRPGTGHVDGPLEIQIASTATTLNYVIGFANRYTPINLTFNSAGGTTGYLRGLSDTITATSSPVSVGLSPAGSGLNDNFNIRRQWNLTIPSGSSFTLGTRKYSAVYNYVSSDLRNGADFNLIEPRLWTGAAWIIPQGTAPSIGVRTATSTGFELLSNLGTVTLSYPSLFTFYSRATGNWTVASSWSTQRYGGAASPISPTQESIVKIGASNTITLNQNFTTTNLVLVDTTGTLDFGANIINGSGEFRLEYLGTIYTSSADGFTTGNNGSVQTTTRSYNYNNHNRGNFGYNGGLNQVLGNGVPAIIGSLFINKTANSATLTVNRTLQDSLYLISGNLIANANIIMWGNIRREGTATFTPGANTLVTFSGPAHQYITNVGSTAEFPFLNLTLNKTDNTGNVILGASTPISIAGTLTFPSTNYAVLNAAKNTGSYVKCSNTTPGNQITRSRGHVAGLLYRYLTAGRTAITFPLGTDTASGYRPLEFTPSTNGNTQGFLGASFVYTNHPDIQNALIDTTMNMYNYWTLNPLESSYALAPGSSFTITTSFRPYDLRTGIPVDFMYHHNRTPSWPETRNVVWRHPPRERFNDTSVTSINVDYFGDFVLGYQGVVYYSRTNGPWNVASSWTTEGYGSTTPATDFPRLATDIARVSYDFKITVPSTFRPVVMATIVENYADKKGTLWIDGNDNNVAGRYFQLEDNCELGVQNGSGIMANNQGAIQTDIKLLGVSRYYFYNYDPGGGNSANGGSGMPDSIAALIIRVCNSPNTFVAPVRSSPGIPFRIRDSLSIQAGRFFTNNRPIFINGDFLTYKLTALDPNFVEATYDPANARTVSWGVNPKRYVLGNTSGIQMKDFEVYDANITLSAISTAANNAYLYINGDLKMFGPVINTRNAIKENYRAVKIDERGSFPRPPVGSFIDGTLIRYVNTSQQFYIGEGSNYTPVTLTFSGSSANAYMAATNYAPVPNEEFVGNRMDQTACVPRYWRVVAEDTLSFIFGARTADLTFQFPWSEINFDTTLAYGRRKSFPVENPRWQSRSFPQLDWWKTVDSAYVSTAAGNFWTGLGEFFFGLVKPRSFYSRDNGTWTDHNSWTSNPTHIGPIVGAYPGDDPSELTDDVHIGLTHNIQLNVDTARIKSLYIYDDSRLDIQQFVVRGSQNFNIDENAYIAFGGAWTPPQALRNFTSHFIGLNSTFEYYGNNQYMTPSPFGLNYGNVLITQNGRKFANLPALIRRNLTIWNTAEFLVTNNVDALRVWGTVYNNAKLDNAGRIEIGD